MLENGTEAPSFSLPGAEGGDVRRFSLREYLGENVVVLCFYPADFDPHSPRRGGWLQDLDLLALQRNVAVLAVGPDTAFSHREFADSYNLDCPLLADTAGAVTEAYGVLDEFEGHRQVPRRAVFVLDDRGVVRYAWTADDPADRPEVEAVRAAIRSLKSDESALERYRMAYDYAQYGHSEFDIASAAFENAEWRLAAEAFDEAGRYFEAASEAADTAHWFAASPDLADRLETARQRVDGLFRACKWFAGAARSHADGDVDKAEEYRRDATRQRQRALDGPALADPDELSALAGDGHEDEEAAGG